MPAFNSKVSICNYALNDIGHASTIQSLSEESTAAVRCNLIYDRARDAVLTAHDWAFARKHEALTLLSYSSKPEYWDYVYQRPATALKMIRLYDATWQRQNLEETRTIDYENALITIASQNYSVIYTDLQSARAVFTANLDEPDRYPQPFVEALAAKISAMIAYPMTGDQTLKREMEQLYLLRLAAAREFDNSQGEDTTDWFNPDSMDARL